MTDPPANARSVGALSGSVSSVGIAAFGLTKLGDLVTTVVGLVVVDGLSERNPFAASLIGRFGIPGLVIATVAVFCLVVVVVEWATTMAERNSNLDSTLLYLISYLPLSLVFALATVNNAVLVYRAGLA